MVAPKAILSIYLIYSSGLFVSTGTFKCATVLLDEEARYLSFNREHNWCLCSVGTLLMRTNLEPGPPAIAPMFGFQRRTFARLHQPFSLQLEDQHCSKDKANDFNIKITIKQGAD